MWRDLRYFFQISRPLNVFITFLAFVVACWLAQGSLYFLLYPTFWGTAFTIVGIAATGYWINDVYDFRIDRINKPHKVVVNAILSVKKVLTVYFLGNLVILGFSALYLGAINGLLHITFINFLTVLLLFVYASYFKRIGVIGNLSISFLIALVLILAYYLTGMMNMSLMWAIVFSFEITFIREITKDVQDIKGDLAYNLRTLPIQIGIEGTKRVLGALYVSFLVTCYLPFIFYYYRQDGYIWSYLISSIILVQLPTIWIAILMARSKEPEDFGRQSSYLKYVMLTGMITLFFLG